MGFEITPHVPIQLNCKAKIMEFLAKNRRCLVTNEITPLISSDKYDFSVYIQENVELLIPLVINQKVAGLVLLGGSRITSYNVCYTKLLRLFIAETIRCV